MSAELPPAIGSNTCAAFTGWMNIAFIAGNIAVLDTVVNAVTDALENNLELLPVHHYILDGKQFVIILLFLVKAQPLIDKCF